MTDCKIGDFVEVDIGHGLCISAYAQVITEHYSTYDQKVMYTVRFNGESNGTFKRGNKDTHQAPAEFIRKLSDKEVFELRLKGVL